VVVFAMSPELYRVAINVASRLRVEGRTVDLILEEKKAKWFFKHSSRIEAKYCFIVAEDEHANGEVQVRDLSDGGQRAVRIDALGEWAKEAFTSTPYKTPLPPPFNIEIRSKTNTITAGCYLLHPYKVEPEQETPRHHVEIQGQGGV